MKGKMAVIGDGDSVLVFKSVGVVPFAVSCAEEAEKILDDISRKFEIIFITDDIAEDIDDKIKKYTSSSYPIIVSVPSKEGSNGYGERNLNDAMQKALGINIFANK